MQSYSFAGSPAARTRSAGTTSSPPSAREEFRFILILLISHIAEMQGGFANTLVIEMGTDQSSRIRMAE